MAEEGRIQVEVLEESLKSKDRETGERYNLSKGDVVTVSDALGQHWCAQGWAKDVAGKVKTGERRVIAATLNPDKAVHASKSKSKGKEA